MYDVFKVVGWLRVRNNADMRQDPNIEELSQMKVMKLLYYIQAASLSISGEQVFDNDIVVWKYEPVIEAVHRKYSGCRGAVNSNYPITPQDLEDYKEPQANEQASNILNSIYDVYGYSSAYDLIRQTHSEKPRQQAPHNGVIRDKYIKDFYSGVFVPDEN